MQKMNLVATDERLAISLVAVSILLGMAIFSLPVIYLIGIKMGVSVTLLMAMSAWSGYEAVRANTPSVDEYTQAKACDVGELDGSGFRHLRSIAVWSIMSVTAAGFAIATFVANL